MFKNFVIISLLAGSTAFAQSTTVEKVITESLKQAKIPQISVVEIQDIQIVDLNTNFTQVTLRDVVKDDAMAMEFTVRTTDDRMGYRTNQIVYNCSVFVSLEKGRSGRLEVEEVKDSCSVSEVPKSLQKNQLASWALNWLEFIRETEAVIYGKNSLFGSLQSQLERCMSNLSEKDFEGKYIYIQNKPEMVKDFGIFQDPDLKQVEANKDSEAQFIALMTLSEARLDALLTKLSEHGRALQEEEVEISVKTNLRKCKAFKQQYNIKD